MFQRNEVEPEQKNEMNESESTHSCQKDELIRSAQRIRRNDAKIVRMEEDQCTNDAMPNAMNDQTKNTHNGVFIHRCQIGDRRLKKEKRKEIQIDSSPLSLSLSPGND